MDNTTTKTTDTPKADTVTVKTTGRLLKGVVIATKMTDTVTVAVDRFVKHAKYGKYQRRTKKYLVHNPGNTATVGDKVEIREVKPISKRKHFVLVK